MPRATIPLGNFFTMLSGSCTALVSDDTQIAAAYRSGEVRVKVTALFSVNGGPPTRKTIKVRRPLAEDWQYGNGHDAKIEILDAEATDGDEVKAGTGLFWLFSEAVTGEHKDIRRPVLAITGSGPNSPMTEQELRECAASLGKENALTCPLGEVAAFFASRGTFVTTLVPAV